MSRGHDERAAKSPDVGRGSGLIREESSMKLQAMTMYLENLSSWGGNGGTDPRHLSGIGLGARSL